MCPPGPVASGGAAVAVAVATAPAPAVATSVEAAASPPSALALAAFERSSRCAGILLSASDAGASPPAAGGVARTRPDGGGGLGAGLLGSLAEVLGDLGHGVVTSLDHSGPLMPPSLRTRQKWIAMKMTITNGSMRTCSTYQRRSVSVPISAPPSSTKRTWFPKTGV